MCLPNEEYLSNDKYERTDKAVKFKIFVNVT